MEIRCFFRRWARFLEPRWRWPKEEAEKEGRRREEKRIHCRYTLIELERNECTRSKRRCSSRPTYATTSKCPGLCNGKHVLNYKSLFLPPESLRAKKKHQSFGTTRILLNEYFMSPAYKNARTRWRKNRIWKICYSSSGRTFFLKNQEWKIFCVLKSQQDVRMCEMRAWMIERRRLLNITAAKISV